MAAMADETVVNRTPLLQPRREAFEQGLLPIDKLIFTAEDTLASKLGELKKKLLAAVAKANDRRVNAAALAKALQITKNQAKLALRKLTAVLPAGGSDVASADIRDVLLFLYIQPYYKRREWSTSTSASDGCRTADQLSYLKRHMENIITLLADSVEGDGSAQVLTMDTFEHLRFLVQSSEGTSLSKAANFFGNSPDMPAARVDVDRVFHWISSSLESNHQTVSDPDVTMTEANTSHPWNSTPSANPPYYRNITFVEALSETSIVNSIDVKGNSIKATCSGQSNESPIYVQSLAVYLLESAKNVHTDPVSGLSKNQLVEQFDMPWNGAQNDKPLVRYTPEGYSIIGGLISHVTNTHLNKKSWDGKITAKMFFVCQGQIHIQPCAIATKVGSPDACWKDLEALIKLICNASELILPPNDTRVYPLHLLNLCNIVGKINRYPVGRRRVLAMSSKLATYIRCNPAFLSHSQKSCICWHLRRFELSSRSASIRQHFRNIIEKMDYDGWFSKIDITHRLFSDTFTVTEAGKKRARYENTSYDFYRFVRDWHTHCLEPTRDGDLAVKEKDAEVKNKYGFEVLESIAEIHFDSYLSDILFNLLLDEHIDIVAWLSDLKPALPIQSQDSNPQNKKYKGTPFVAINSS